MIIIFVPIMFNMLNKGYKNFKIKHILIKNQVLANPHKKNK